MLMNKMARNCFHLVNFPPSLHCSDRKGGRGGKNNNQENESSDEDDKGKKGKERGALHDTTMKRFFMGAAERNSNLSLSKTCFDRFGNA